MSTLENSKLNITPQVILYSLCPHHDYVVAEVICDRIHQEVDGIEKKKEKKSILKVLYLICKY